MIAGAGEARCCYTGATVIARGEGVCYHLESGSPNKMKGRQGSTEARPPTRAERLQGMLGMGDQGRGWASKSQRRMSMGYPPC